MHFAPRNSVRVQLAFAILAAILLSWIISGGLSNYFMYLGMKNMRQEMVRHSGFYEKEFPEPRFGLKEFFLGPRDLFGGPPHEGEPPSPPPEWMKGPMKGGMPPFGPPPDRLNDGTMNHHPGPPGGPRHGHHPPPPRPIEGLLATGRILVALLLSTTMGRWLAGKFTRPLTQLAAGAQAFHAGDFTYRIPMSGDDEFADVARAMNDMAERVQVQLNGLEQDAELRRQFLANAAHELRSPVTTMRTMAGALSEGLAKDPARSTRAVEALVRTSERLIRLVSDLMELAKLDLKELPLRITSTDLRSLVSTAIQTHQDQAREAGITLQSCEPGSPVLAQVDPDRMLQVLDNLIDNAISYSGSGASVNVSLDGGSPVRIVVSDTGKGIDEGHVSHVFDSFYRADQARSPGGTHSGLGLAITRGIVEAHGGKIELSSGEGKGTTVVISLPGA